MLESFRAHRYFGARWLIYCVFCGHSWPVFTNLSESSFFCQTQTVTNLLIFTNYSLTRVQSEKYQLEKYRKQQQLCFLYKCFDPDQICFRCFATYLKVLSVRLSPMPFHCQYINLCVRRNGGYISALTTVALYFLLCIVCRLLISSNSKLFNYQKRN